MKKRKEDVSKTEDEEGKSDGELKGKKRKKKIVKTKVNKEELVKKPENETITVKIIDDLHAKDYKKF